MRIIITIICFVLSGASYGQHGTLDQQCEDSFWRNFDINYLDTITIFYDHNECIKKLPDRLYQISGLKHLILNAESSLETLSPQIRNLNKLETMVIQKSKIRQLPVEICELTKLKRLTIAWGGQLEYLPENIGQLESLEFLNLYRNKLTELPESIKELKKLERLVLGENKFSKAEQAKIIGLLPNCKVSFGYEY